MPSAAGHSISSTDKLVLIILLYLTSTHVAVSLGLGLGPPALMHMVCAKMH